jgi:hypothetical protein
MLIINSEPIIRLVCFVWAISGDIHLIFSQMDAYEIFRVLLCSGPDR